MDWNDFDECFGKLRTILREMLFADEGNPYKREIYGNYLGFGSDIKIIIQRIEAEIQQSLEISEKLHAYMPGRIMDITKRKEESENELVMEGDRIFKLLGLDIKSFFVFTRIFLDTLAKIVRLCFGKEGTEHLPWSMRELVGHKKLEEFDSDFAEGLKDKMSWMTPFLERRVEIEHYLGGIPSATMKNGKFWFQIIGSRVRKNRETHARESATDYIEEVLSNVSEVILHICQKFQSQKT